MGLSSDKKINSYFYNLILILLFCFAIISTYIVFFKYEHIHSVFTNSRLLELIPFFKTIVDPGILANDFYTQAILEPNPKQTYAFFLFYISKLFNAEPFHSFYIVSFFCTLTLPVISFLCITKTAFYMTGSLSRLAIITAALGSILLPGLSKVFTVGSWFYATTLSVYNFLYVVIPDANAFATLLALVFFVLYQPNYCFVRNLPATVFLCFASIFNPVIVLGVLVLAFLLFFSHFIKLSNGKLAVVVVIGCVIPVLILKIFFSSAGDMSAEEFLKLYVHYRHAHHYDLYYAFNHNYFYSIVKGLIGNVAMPEILKQIIVLGSRYINFALPIVIYLCALFALYKKRGTVFYFLFFLGSAYIGYIVFQYLINTVLVSKFLIQLGPMRLTGFGALYAAIAVTIAVNLLVVKLKTNQSSFRHLNNQSNAGLVVVILISSFILSYFTLNNTKNFEQSMSSHYPEMLLWIKQNTSEDAVFVSDCAFSGVSPSDALLSIDRAVVVSGRFIFTEKYMPAYYERLLAICGKNPLQIRDPELAYFNNLSDTEYQSVIDQYDVDYMIVRNTRAEQINRWQKVYIGENYTIIDVTASD